tara:strand:- start:106 stop:1152 length:1047 start_codon:yes stop_codon:yes gene_type:complete
MRSRVFNLKYFFRDSDKKGIFKIIKEMIIYGWIKKELPTDYIRNFLYRKEIIEYKNYLSLNQFNRIISSNKLVFPEISSILNNKLSFSYFFEHYKLPTPELISYNLKNYYHFKGTVSLITNKTDLAIYFINVFEATKEDKLFLKLLDAVSGKGAILLDKKRLNTQLERYGDALLNNSYIHQKVLVQHAEINKIHSESINSVRIITYIDKNNDIHILSALMRFGIGKSILDNVGSGGFAISINMDTGTLQGIGRQSITKGGAVYIKHPNTNVKLNGFKIPFFLEACELSKKAATYLPNRIVGWDIAICVDGPIIIEGNHNPSLHLSDIAYGGYCTHPLIKEILKELKMA